PSPARCHATAIEARRALRERRRAPGAGRTAGRSGRTRPHMSDSPVIPACMTTGLRTREFLLGSSPPVTLDVDTTPAAPTLRGARAILLISALVLTVLAFQRNASPLSPALPQTAPPPGRSEE